jgi:alpha-tubulin suppressor-like RCC1 family protein
MVLSSVLVATSDAGAILPGSSFTQVLAGATNSCGLTSADALYCWGADAYGQLLDDGTTPEDAPVLLDLSNELTGGQTITQLAGGAGSICILTSGTATINPEIWCWGYGGQGQLGDGHFSSSSNPEQVIFSGSVNGNLVSLVGGGESSASFCALTSGNTSAHLPQVWCWGDNLSTGALGNGTNSNADVPTLIDTAGVLSGVKMVSLGGFAKTFCVTDSNGDAFCWGQGNDGQLGNDSTSNSNVPVQVDTSVMGTGDSVEAIAPSPTHTCVLDTQGNVWCWGDNTYGEVGVGQDAGVQFDIPQKVTSLDGNNLSAVTTSSSGSCVLTAGSELYCWGDEPIGNGVTSGSAYTPVAINGGDLTERPVAAVSLSDYITCAIDTQASLYCWGENGQGQVGDGTIVTSQTPEEIAVSPSATPLETVPNAPKDPTATPGDGNIAVTWNTPYSDGGSAITSFTATATDVLNSADTFQCGGGASATGCEISGLTDGHSYNVSIVATNAIGNSEPALVPGITPVTVPDAPTLTSVTGSDTQITVDWSAPVFNGGSTITGYTATAIDTTNSANVFTCQTTGLTCAETGLTDGIAYSVSVIATNAIGNSVASSSLDATPGTNPDAPQTPSLTPGNDQIAVSWTAPASDGGAPLIEYVATATNGSTNHNCIVDAPATSCTIDGLTNGLSYTVTVAVTNSFGESPPLNAGSAVPTGPPDAPTLGSVTVANGSLVVNWTAPSNDGGSTITGYTATADLSGVLTTCAGGASATSCTVTGLVNGTSYIVFVTATNGLGTSGDSNTMNGTPGTAPGVPLNVLYTLGNGSVTLQWGAPTTNGGYAISDYEVAGSNGLSTCVTTSTTCTFTKLTGTTAYTFTLWAVNSLGNSTSVKSVGIFPVAPGHFTLYSVNEVVNQLAPFQMIAAGGAPGSTVTLAMTGAKLASCTMNAVGECTVTLKQPALGIFRIVGKIGGTPATYSVYVPILAASTTVKKGTKAVVHISYVPSGSTVVIKLSDGRSFSAKASSLNVATFNVVMTKVGSFKVTCTVNGVSITQSKKIKVT